MLEVLFSFAAAVFPESSQFVTMVLIAAWTFPWVGFSTLIGAWVLLFKSTLISTGFLLISPPIMTLGCPSTRLESAWMMEPGQMPFWFASSATSSAELLLAVSFTLLTITKLPFSPGVAVLGLSSTPVPLSIRSCALSFP